MGLAVKETPAASESPLSHQLAWLLSRASYALATELTAGLSSLGLSPRGHCVLSSALGGQFTQTELARMVGLDKTTMVVTLDELEAAGLAKRVPASHDRRARVVAVTKAGERKIREGEAIVRRIQDDVLATLPGRQRQVLMDALATLVRDRLSEGVECSPSVRRREPRA
jgi:MarR family transcriptional regulator, transcriptional regulator for hemolysin